MVLGFPDAVWGRAVAALVTTGDGFDAATVRAGLTANLAACKLPRHLFAVEEIPRHASGKGDYRKSGEGIAALTG